MREYIQSDFFITSNLHFGLQNDLFLKNTVLWYALHLTRNTFQIYLSIGFTGLK